uniref:Cytochrome P450 n=1 Tax=Lotus japonicus TaxID=34305 RepID=I3SJN0_LOTJA|nr:unknown [Lotus japonicus]
MDTLSSALLFLLTCVVMLAFHSLFSGRNKKNLPPGPTPLPIVGNLFAMGDKPYKSLAKLAEIYGPVLHLKLGHVTTIVVSSPDTAKEVLQTHDSSLSDRTIPHALTAFNHHQFGVGFLPLSPLWKDMRRVCKNQLFSVKSLDANQDLRRKKVQELLSDVQQSSLSGEAVDIGKAAFKASINLLSNTIFSVDFAKSAGGTGEHKDIVLSMSKFAGSPNVADFFPWLRFIDPQSIKRNYVVYIGKLFGVFDSIIDKRLKLRHGAGFITNYDWLDSLLDLSEGNSKEMDTEKIKHLMHVLFLIPLSLICSVIYKHLNIVLL